MIDFFSVQRGGNICKTCGKRIQGFVDLGAILCKDNPRMQTEVYCKDHVPQTGSLGNLVSIQVRPGNSIVETGVTDHPGSAPTVAPKFHINLLANFDSGTSLPIVYDNLLDKAAIDQLVASVLENYGKPYEIVPNETKVKYDATEGKFYVDATADTKVPGRPDQSLTERIYLTLDDLIKVEPTTIKQVNGSTATWSADRDRAVAAIEANVTSGDDTTKGTNIATDVKIIRPAVDKASMKADNLQHQPDGSWTIDLEADTDQPWNNGTPAQNTKKAKTVPIDIPDPEAISTAVEDSWSYTLDPNDDDDVGYIRKVIGSDSDCLITFEGESTPVAMAEQMTIDTSAIKAKAIKATYEVKTYPPTHPTYPNQQYIAMYSHAQMMLGNNIVINDIQAEQVAEYPLDAAKEIEYVELIVTGDELVLESVDDNQATLVYKVKGHYDVHYKNISAAESVPFVPGLGGVDALGFLKFNVSNDISITSVEFKNWGKKGQVQNPTYNTTSKKLEGPAYLQVGLNMVDPISGHTYHDVAFDVNETMFKVPAPWVYDAMAFITSSSVVKSRESVGTGASKWALKLTDTVYVWDTNLNQMLAKDSKLLLFHTDTEYNTKVMIPANEPDSVTIANGNDLMHNMLTRMDEADCYIYKDGVPEYMGTGIMVSDGAVYAPGSYREVEMTVYIPDPTWVATETDQKTMVYTKQVKIKIPKYVEMHTHVKEVNWEPEGKHYNLVTYANSYLYNKDGEEKSHDVLPDDGKLVESVMKHLSYECDEDDAHEVASARDDVLDIIIAGVNQAQQYDENRQPISGVKGISATVSTGQTVYAKSNVKNVNCIVILPDPTWDPDDPQHATNRRNLLEKTSPAKMVDVTGAHTTFKRLDDAPTARENEMAMWVTNEGYTHIKSYTPSSEAEKRQYAKYFDQDQDVNVWTLNEMVANTKAILDYFSDGVPYYQPPGSLYPAQKMVTGLPTYNRGMMVWTKGFGEDVTDPDCQYELIDGTIVVPNPTIPENKTGTPIVPNLYEVPVKIWVPKGTEKKITHIQMTGWSEEGWSKQPATRPDHDHSETIANVPEAIWFGDKNDVANSYMKAPGEFLITYEDGSTASFKEDGTAEDGKILDSTAKYMPWFHGLYPYGEFDPDTVTIVNNSNNPEENYIQGKLKYRIQDNNPFFDYLDYGGFETTVKLTGIPKGTEGKTVANVRVDGWADDASPTYYTFDSADKSANHVLGNVKVILTYNDGSQTTHNTAGNFDNFPQMDKPITGVKVLGWDYGVVPTVSQNSDTIANNYAQGNVKIDVNYKDGTKKTFVVNGKFNNLPKAGSTTITKLKRGWEYATNGNVTYTQQDGQWYAESVVTQNQTLEPTTQVLPAESLVKLPISRPVDSLNQIEVEGLRQSMMFGDIIGPAMAQLTFPSSGGPEWEAGKAILAQQEAENNPTLAAAYEEAKKNAAENPEIAIAQSSYGGGTDPAGLGMLVGDLFNGMEPGSLNMVRGGDDGAGISSVTGPLGIDDSGSLLGMAESITDRLMKNTENMTPTERNQYFLNNTDKCQVSQLLEVSPEQWMMGPDEFATPGETYIEGPDGQVHINIEPAQLMGVIPDPAPDHLVCMAQYSMRPQYEYYYDVPKLIGFTIEPYIFYMPEDEAKV